MKKLKNHNWRISVSNSIFNNSYLLWFILLSLTILFTFLQFPPSQKKIFLSYNIGDVGHKDIKAPNDLLIEDAALTETKRNQAGENVKVVYDFDASLSSEILKNVDNAFEMGQLIFIGHAQHESIDNIPYPDFGLLLKMKSEFESTMGVHLSNGAYNILYKYKFVDDIGEKIKIIVNKLLTNGIVANKEILLKEENKGIVLRNIQSKEEQSVKNLALFYDIDQAKSMVRKIGEPILEELNYNLSNLIIDICEQLIQPNITLNKSETERRIQMVEEEIKPVMYRIKAGEMILREGELVDNIKQIKLKALQKQINHKGIITSVVGIGATIFFMILIPYFFLLKDHPHIKKDHNKHIIFLACGLLLYLGAIQAVIYLTQTGNQEHNLNMGANFFFMLIPIQAASMSICFFLSFDIAIYFTLVLAILSGFAFSGNFVVLIYFFLSGIASAWLVRRRQKRKHFIVAGFKLGLFNSLLVTTIGLQAVVEPNFLVLLKQALMGFCGGLGAVILTIGFSPLIEILFNYTTETKLLEFSNLDQPLIRKLMIQAPGTYNHSLIVATLAEAAATAIGSSGLKAKVMGYYHDIGKLDKPMYFIENQFDGKNRHDKLSPYMSALILIQHVKKGVELANKYKLSKEIIEAITQHHGTSLIKYFYHKSLNSGNENIDEESFRYPGPKPQTREAAIVMLADVAEAAVRSLERPTSSRIRGRVKELINSIFADGQLEESELTLKDLHEIAKSFNNILTTIYHNRIEYTDKPQEKKKNGTGKNIDRQSAKIESANSHASQKDTTNLKRLGL